MNLPFRWMTYGYRANGDYIWIENLDAENRIKSLLRLEVVRLENLVTGGHYFDHEKSPIPPTELNKFQNDLSLWTDPVAVLWLLENCPWVIGGPKTRPKVVAAVKAYVEAQNRPLTAT